MADFAPPSGPPPPTVPEGWKAVWNEQYSTWFFVNKYTKKSQWDKPTEPVYPPSSDNAPPGPPPPSYDQSTGRNAGSEKAGLRPTSSSSRGAADSYYSGGPGGASPAYGQGPGSSYGGGPQQQRPLSSQGNDPQQRGGFFSKFTGGSSSQPGYGQQGYGSPAPPPQGGYPPRPYGQQPPYGQQYPPQQGGYGYPPQPQGYYPPPQQQAYAQQQPQQKKHGMGMGGALLGAGAGLVGGALLMDAIDDHDQAEYQQGFDQGEAADDGGGDWGGDDGGDF